MTMERIGKYAIYLCNIIFGAVDELLYALIAFVAIDYITGICVAAHDKKLSSNVGAKGISKKVAIFAMIALSNIADRFLLKSGGALRTVTTIFYLSNECISIFENVGHLGLPVPPKLQAILKYFEKYNS